MATAAQRAHRERVRAFYARHGRFPRKGELGATRARPAAPATAVDAPKRRRRRAKPDLATSAWRWVRKNPVKTSLAVAALGAAAVPAVRTAVADTAAKTVAFVRG